jgi:hypothetical protein
MHPGYVQAPKGDLVGGGLRWIEGRERKGPRIWGEYAGEELASSYIISDYLEAFRCNSCNAVFILLSGE